MTQRVSHQRVDAMLFEACVDSVDSAKRAVAGGARRLELCAALIEGGLTPSIGLVRGVANAVAVPLHVLIRPRPGDFLYSDDETIVMLADIEACKAAGAAGVVLGALLADGTVDVERTARLVAAAKPLAVTFHRAIDVTPDPLAAMRALHAVGGIDYVLTSGGAATALEGADTIRRMIEATSTLGCGDSTTGVRGGTAAAVDAAGARPSITLIAGGGVTPATAGAIVAATGVTQLHGTARITVPSRMVYRHTPVVYMGGEKVNTPDAEFSIKVASSESVAAIIAAATAAAEVTHATETVSAAATC